MGLPGASNDTITCNTSPRVYSGGELSCSVQNPTLSALYPGSVHLNIIRTYNSSYALASGLTSYGSSGSIHAELFYEGEEQFFCQAGACTVLSDDKSSNWTCSDLKCNCRTGTAMCGATPVRLQLPSSSSHPISPTRHKSHTPSLGPSVLGCVQDLRCRGPGRTSSTAEPADSNGDGMLSRYASRICSGCLN